LSHFSRLRKTGLLGGWPVEPSPSTGPEGLGNKEDLYLGNGNGLMDQRGCTRTGSKGCQTTRMTRSSIYTQTI